MFYLERTPIPKRETGGKLGPQGLGDPNDVSLRTIEKEVVIPEMMRDKASKNQCKQPTKEFFECARDNGVLIVPNCVTHRDRLISCMDYWLHDKEFKKETTVQYLKERSEYRRTGEPVRPSKRIHAGTHN